MKKTISALLVLCFLTGCGHDASDLTVVTGISVDGVEHNYKIGADVIRLTGSEQEQKTVLLHSEGVTVTDAIGRLVAITGRSLYCNHAQILLIGRETAEHGLLPLLEELLCENQYPITLRMAVVKDQALAAMKSKSVIGDLHSIELSDIIKSGSFQCLTADMDISRFYQDICAEGIEGVAPFIELRQNENDKICSLYGTALFSGDQMLTVLDGRDSRLLMWLRGQTGGNFATSYGTMEMVYLKRKVTVDTAGAEIELHMTLKVDDSENGEDVLRAETQQLLEQECMLLIEQLQELQCDAIGIGQQLQRTDRNAWKDIRTTWKQRFADYPIRVSVHIDNIIWGRIWSDDISTGR